MRLFKYNTRLVKTRLDHEEELNQELSDDSGYICKLVAGYSGFELSKLDYCLGF